MKTHKPSQIVNDLVAKAAADRCQEPSKEEFALKGDVKMEWISTENRCNVILADLMLFTFSHEDEVEKILQKLEKSAKRKIERFIEARRPLAIGERRIGGRLIKEICVVGKLSATSHSGPRRDGALIVGDLTFTVEMTPEQAGRFQSIAVDGSTFLKLAITEHE